MLSRDEVRELGIALDFPTKWSIATLSGSQIGRAHPRRGQKSLPISCAGPTPSSSTNCGPPTGTTRPARPSPYFAGQKSVGVMGDMGTYDVVALRAVRRIS